MLNIYLSSTYEDLKNHRERVYHHLRSLRHDVIAMEDYVASDNRPVDKCLADVRKCDVYIGIFAWRYGYVPKTRNPEHRSITELEYREAIKHRKPALIFVVNETAPWSPALMDAATGENKAGERIRDFRAVLRQKHVAAMFETPDELAAKVGSALTQWQMDASQANAAGSAPLEKEYLHAGDPAAPRSDSPLLWAPGSCLRVRFLSGDATLRARIIRLAQIWGAYANLGFVESEAPDAEVRVAFDPAQGSWSYEGTRCLDVPKTEPTMNFGWLNTNSPIEDLESVVLHEFGHVLGLAHEHLNPAGAVPWDRKKVYKALTGPPNHWDKATIDQMVFHSWSEDRFPFQKPFDPLSIMAWSFPAEFTGGEEIFRRNVAVSAGDKEFVSRLYPYRAAAPAPAPRPRARAAAASRRKG